MIESSFCNSLGVHVGTLLPCRFRIHGGLSFALKQDIRRNKSCSVHEGGAACLHKEQEDQSHAQSETPQSALRWLHGCKLATIPKEICGTLVVALR